MRSISRPINLSANSLIFFPPEGGIVRHLSKVFYKSAFFMQNKANFNGRNQKTGDRRREIKKCISGCLIRK